MHRSMKLMMRCQASMEGFLILDMFKITAEATAKRKGLPRGACFLAPQTLENLQLVAMSTILVCISKEEEGDPFARGHLRMTELGIEEWFGRLRVQSSNAQLSAKSYWQAAARDMVRASRRSTSKSGTMETTKPALTDEEFHTCSQRAWESAKTLVSICAGVTPESLETMYRQWCESGKLEVSTVDLVPEEVEDEMVGDFDDEDEDEFGAVLNEIKETIHEQCGEEFATLEGADLQAALLDLELSQVPDKEALIDMMKVTAESPLKEACRETMDPAFDLSIQPQSLYQAIVQDKQAQDKKAIFWDRLWRLIMYLRHWKGGGDKTWIKNAKSSRKAASNLNWHQRLALFTKRVFCYVLLLFCFLFKA